jgi:hypothetical protein
LWQYDEAVNLQALLAEKKAWYDENQTLFWKNWYRDIFDLRTANFFGLRIWSIILGQPIYVNRAPKGRPTFGFEEFHVNFTRGNFSDATGNSYPLSTEAARVLLRLRYYQLISSGTVPEANRMLADVFRGYVTEGQVPAYLVDNNDMTQKYVFTFQLTAELIYLFKNFDILPRPAGVGSDYEIIIDESWGFGEFHENFENGNFSGN